MQLIKCVRINRTYTVVKNKVNEGLHSFQGHIILSVLQCFFQLRHWSFRMRWRIGEFNPIHAIKKSPFDLIFISLMNLCDQEMMIIAHIAN